MNIHTLTKKTKGSHHQVEKILENQSLLQKLLIPLRNDKAKYIYKYVTKWGQTCLFCKIAVRCTSEMRLFITTAFQSNIDMISSSSCDILKVGYR